ncbi:sodium:dicarboxylate symporter [Virgibacillus sp. NKC19-3]|uniref:YesK family protein n=1 Tax=Virgibacillus saliphilus TaxID=2831674 RepID=UPI001C9B9860|nr:YesK family protein [Virgibacillus sp. NKC19-3]MBY7144921.1 sodium:dicarboxylate symporter [Virgibacillus sp. NKC19-3]
MDRLLLSEWLPIILTGVLVAVIIVTLAFSIKKAVLYIITTILSLVCISLIVFSLVGIGGWEGMGLGLFAVSAFLGLTVGVLICPFIKSKRDLF